MIPPTLPPITTSEQQQSVALARQLGQLPPGSAPVLTQRPLQLHAVTQISQPQATRLSNGAQAFCQQMTSDTYSTLAVVLPVTPADQAMQLMGSLMASTGTQQRRQDLDRWASQGILVTMTPIGDRTVLLVNAKTGHEREMTDVAMQMLTRLPIDPDTFATQKTTLLKTMVNQDNAPGTAFTERMTQALYGKEHPYAMTHAQMFEQLRRLQPEQVRQYFDGVTAHPELAQVVMVSPLPTEQQAALLDQSLATRGWTPRLDRPSPAATVPAIAPQTPPSGQPLLVAENSLERVHLTRSWLGPTPDHPDFDAFKVMTSLLSGMTGPLFRILRTERGLVYSTEHAFDFHQRGSAYNVTAQVDFDKVPQAMDGLQEAINTLILQPPDASDLERVKREYVMELRLERQQSADMAEKHLLALSNGLPPEEVQAQEARILALTPEKIQQVARQFLGPDNPQAVTGLTGPANVLSGLFPGMPIEQGQHLSGQQLATALQQVEASRAPALASQLPWQPEASSDPNRWLPAENPYPIPSSTLTPEAPAKVWQA